MCDSKFFVDTSETLSDADILNKIWDTIQDYDGEPYNTNSELCLSDNIIRILMRITPISGPVQSCYGVPIVCVNGHNVCYMREKKEKTMPSIESVVDEWRNSMIAIGLDNMPRIKPGMCVEINGRLFAIWKICHYPSWRADAVEISNGNDVSITSKDAIAKVYEIPSPCKPWFSLEEYNRRLSLIWQLSDTVTMTPQELLKAYEAETGKRVKLDVRDALRPEIEEVEKLHTTCDDKLWFLAMLQGMDKAIAALEACNDRE